MKQNALCRVVKNAVLWLKIGYHTAVNKVNNYIILFTFITIRTHQRFMFESVNQFPEVLTV